MQRQTHNKNVFGHLLLMYTLLCVKIPTIKNTWLYVLTFVRTEYILTLLQSLAKVIWISGSIFTRSLIWKMLLFVWKEKKSSSACDGLHSSPGCEAVSAPNTCVMAHTEKHSFTHGLHIAQVLLVNESIGQRFSC